MSLREIAHRATVSGKTLREEIFPNRSLRTACENPLAIRPARERPSFHPGPRELQILRNALEPDLPDLFRRADTICEHRFSFLGLEGAFLGKRINWHLEPVAKIEVPCKPASRLDYRDPEQAGDVKYIWEINRHQHLPLLALAYCFRKNPLYLDEIRFQIRDWILQNPYPRGINWTSALETGARLISWSWTFFLLHAAGETVPARFFRSVGEHCGFIHRNFSLYSSRGNHLVGEAAGLFTGALLFAREPYRSRWTGDAYRILTSQIQELVLPDGAYAELSTGYHQFAMDLFLLPALLGKENGIEFPRQYWDRLEAMTDFLDDTRDPAGWRWDQGDNDAARCLAFEGHGYDNHQSLLTTGALLFHKPRGIRNVPRPDIKSLLLLGEKALKEFPLLQEEGRSAPRNRSRAFSDAGCYILRSHMPETGEIFLVFDAGPMGMEPMAGHGHADTLSFVLSVDGQPFFIDPGTCTYRTDDPYRNYFRGTSAHNTLRVDGEDLSVAGGGFLWTRKARCHDIVWKGDTETPTVRATHDGYKRLTDPVGHTREILLDKKNLEICILDEVRAKRQHSVELFFHLDPSCEVRIEGDTHWISAEGRQIGLLMDAGVECRIVKGRTDPMLGWQSRGYGQKEPAYSIIGSDTPTGNVRYRTRILLKK